MPKFIEIGVSGLRQWSGFIDEERLRKLSGERARKIYREMSDNDAVIGAILFAIEMLLRNVKWRVEPFDDSPQRKEEAEFVETLMGDMSHTWEDFIAEVLSMLPFGFAPHEIVYKFRGGMSGGDGTTRSKFNDGLIGWRKLPLRSQDSLDRWEFDDDGGIRGFWQDPPDASQQLFIPIEKTLLFRTTSRKNNPEGRSVLRNSYVSWYHKTRIASYEAIGVERDLAGMPIFYLPPEIMADDATPEVKAQYAEYKKLVENIKNDEQSGLILPSIYDENNNQMLTFELAGTGSSRMFDTGAIIDRYNKEMAMTVLADFILLGHEKVGSFALSSDKTDMFGTAMGAWLSSIAAVLNRFALPRLYDLNAWQPEETAQFVPGDIEKVDIERFAIAIAQLTAGGFLTPGGETDEEHVRNLMDLPPAEVLPEI